MSTRTRLNCWKILGPEGTFISVLTYIEVFQGILRDPEPERSRRSFQAFVGSSPAIALDTAVAEQCARLRQYFQDRGQRPARRGYDLLIAATALEYDLMLVTRNVRDYVDIPGLKLYPGSTG
jgi:predicted nucleic acid-binding protein